MARDMKCLGLFYLVNLCVYVRSITNWTAILYMKYVAMKKDSFRGFFSVLFLGHAEWKCLPSDSL